MITITTNESNPATLKLIVASNLAKKEVRLKYLSPADKNPRQPNRLPYLEYDDDESSIFIPNAGVWLLLTASINKLDDLKKQKVNEWLEWEATVLAPSIAQPLGTSSKNDEFRKLIASSLRKLDDALGKGSGLSLITKIDEVTACDVSIWSLLYPLYLDITLSRELLEQYLNVMKWIKALEIRPEFKEATSIYIITPGTQSYQSLMTGGKYLSTRVSLVGKESPLHQPDVISPAELESAVKAWGNAKIANLKPPTRVVLPKPNEKNVLITSALPYVNNVPHLGNIIGCVLSSDVFARFCRICNHNTLFIGGTDEYGTATETKALEEGLTCREICDKYYAVHNDIYKWFDISFDYFGRTSEPEQTEICQDFFLQLNDNGFMFTDTIEQLHCEKCDRFLADRFVEGGCPHIGCTYADARGDQCDGCGKLVNAIDLKNPRCKICGNTPKLRKSSQFFLDLPKLEPLLLHWMKTSSPGWSSNAQVIGKTWLREGLKPRCITRDLKWGVPVPLKEYSNKVFYVWFDAPVGYMSITKAYSKEWEQWWRPQRTAGVTVTLYQFMAKDNVPFHSVMFPACLLGANRGYITVNHIMATEYLNYEDGKFSKSRGVGVFGTDARDTGIPSDVWRFYLLYVRPESQDSSFSWADLATKTNSELLNNLGNFINRALMFAKNNFNRTVPEMNLTKDDWTFLVLCTRELKSYVTCLEKSKLRDGIRHILSISRHGNQYMQSNQPWVLLKGSADDKVRAGTVIGVSCNIACLLGLLLHPYMPQTSENLKKQLNSPDIALTPENPEISRILPSGHRLGEPSPLFTKLEPAVVEEMKKKFAGKQDESNNKSKGGPMKNGGQNDVTNLESEIAKQADKVRALKSSGIDKKLWQPEVAALLNLKKELEQCQKAVTCQIGGDQDVKGLEDLITQQGGVVRKLKEGGADKSLWQPEVAKLLDLKKQLATLTGVTVVSGGNQKGKKIKKSTN